MNYQFIESQAQLKDICDDFLAEKIIGVDLEADSMYCFKEKICLIQIATKEQAFLIDPFEFKDLSPFLNILENHDIVKVFHGADFDIRSLDRDYKTRVNTLFDTEIACRFLSIKERGLGALLKRYFNVDSNKKYQKANWSKRPFNQGMVEYSVMDVAFLVKLYKIILQKLTDKGRLSWAQEEFEVQEQVRYENNHQSPLFKKFKGAGKIDSRSLAVLENLLQLRMQIAEKKDQPLFKIMSNASLMTMAKKKPATVAQISKIRALNLKQTDMYGEFCVKSIIKAEQLEQEQLPLYPKPKRQQRDVKVEKRIRQLKKMRDRLSCSMGMEQGFLLNNAVIGSIALNPPAALEDLFKIDNMRQWQVESLGNDVMLTLG